MELVGYEDIETRNSSSFSLWVVHGNWWHDNYWGNCNCDRCKDIKGQNKLGKMLMDLREEFRNPKSQDLEKIYDFQWGGDIK